MWRVVVSGTRTAASGQWPVASEIEEAETTVIEKRRNKPNLPVVLTIGRLSLRTNRGGIEQEKRTQFPAGGNEAESAMAFSGWHARGFARMECRRRHAGRGYPADRVTPGPDFP